MLEEIYRIPEAARDCMAQHSSLRFAPKIPLMGMGSSYYAAYAAKFATGRANVEQAADFIQKPATRIKRQSLVLISQSGRSTEVLEAANRSTEVIAITNDPDSPLAKAPNCVRVIPMYAGEEKLSATITYFNTLLILYKGLRLFEPQVLTGLDQHWREMEDWGKAQAEAWIKNPPSKLFIIGSGPNYATACQASLLLAECCRWLGIPLTLAQLDHGYKEAAVDASIWMLDGGKPSDARQKALIALLRPHAREVIELPSALGDWRTEPLFAIHYVNFLVAYLAKGLGIHNPFGIGGKVTSYEV